MYDFKPYKYLLVTECLRLRGLDDEALLCSEIDTDISDPIESHPCPDSCVTRDTSASDEPVNVETGLVFADVNELHDCIGPDILRLGLFSKKNPKRTCNSS